MAKTKPSRRKDKSKRSPANKQTSVDSSFTPEIAQTLLDEATSKLQTGDAQTALDTAQKLQRLIPADAPIYLLPVYDLLGDIHIELGDPHAAREAFGAAASLDPAAELPEEAGGGADKFLWLAQLSEEGGQESLSWFDKGITALRREIAAGESARSSTKRKADDDDDDGDALEVKRRKLADALCGAAELYMTDLSWEEDAETRCEALVTEACIVAPAASEPLQTLASVRLSQSRREDARAALERSMGMWSSLPDDDPGVPAYATRISLARLLMEAELAEQALEVLDRLVTEDDSSVEAWYLGGWCQRLLADGQEEGDKRTRRQRSSRVWLRRSLTLFAALEYEDERLEEHARELVSELDGILGPAGEDEDEDDDEWEDDDPAARDDANDEDDNMEEA